MVIRFRDTVWSAWMPFTISECRNAAADAGSRRGRRRLSLQPGARFYTCKIHDGRIRGIFGEPCRLVFLLILI